MQERCKVRRALTEGQSLPRVYGCLIARSASKLAEMQQKRIERNVATHCNVLQPDSTQKLFVPKLSVVDWGGRCNGGGADSGVSTA